MKRACVARQNWRWREVRRSQYVDIGKPIDKVSRAGRSRFQALCAWMRPRSGTGERQGLRVPHTRLHGRIPGNRGPCSTFRRVADFGRNPGTDICIPMVIQGLARVLAHGFVASPLLSRSKRRALLRALSQNRDSASRVSLC